MLAIKLLRLLEFIRTNWIHLPRSLQLELVEQLDDYKELIIISKYERNRK